MVEVKAAHPHASVDEMPEDQVRAHDEVTSDLALKPQIEMLRGPAWNAGRKQYVGAASGLFYDLNRP
jgi:hypothetical protein